MKFCTRCKTAEAIVVRGSEALCESCAFKEAMNVSGAIAGGKVLEMPKMRSPGDSVVGVEVIFIGPDGMRKLIRLPDSEQMNIAQRIIDNRRHGNRELQYAEVMVLNQKDFQQCEKAVGIVERLAGTDNLKDRLFGNNQELEALRTEAKELMKELKDE